MRQRRDIHHVTVWRRRRYRRSGYAFAGDWWSDHLILPMLVFCFGQVVTRRWNADGSTYFHLPLVQRCWSGIETVVVSGLAGWENVSRAF